MSVDTTFKPIGPTTLIVETALQLVTSDMAPGITTFRVRALAAGYLTWGRTSAVTAAGAPSAGAPVSNTLGMASGGIVYLELPSSSYFIANNTTGFEVTPGLGGCGGTA